MVDIKRFDHIGMVVPDLEAQAALLSGLFGFQQTHTWEDRDSGARGALFDVPSKTGVQWEVLSPTNGGPLQDFIDGPNGPGLHHVTIEVHDAAAAANELQGDGVRPAVSGQRVSIGPDAGGEGFTFQLRSSGDTGPCINGTDVTSTQPPGGTENTLGIVAIDHICHAYPDRDELARKFGDMFGMRQIWRTPDGEHPDFADLVLETQAQMLWEVIMPKGDESFIQRFLDKRGPSVHHIAFEVADWDRAIAACEAHGIPVFDESTGETDGVKWRDIFIHPKHTGGMLVQFFWEEKAGVWIRSDKIRPEGFAA